MESKNSKKSLYEILGQDINVPNSFSNSILNFNYKKKKDIKINIYKKVAVAFSFVLLSINLVTYGLMLNENYKAESSIGYVNSSLQQATENGYIQNIEMDYLYSNNIGVKVDYVIMSDYNLNILFNFDISNKKIKENVIANIEDLLIYDENNNVIYCYDYKTYKSFCKKNNIEYDEKEINQYTNGFGWEQIEGANGINKSLYKFTSIEGFPKSEKLFIQFNMVHFDKEKSNKINGKWNLELNLNEQFYNREEIKYELKTNSNDIELISANITDTVMRITYKIKNANINENDNISMYIEDSFGNRYDANNIEDSISICDAKISVTFPITTDIRLEDIILYIVINSEEYICNFTN